jgi:hypothetical protein
MNVSLERRPDQEGDEDGRHAQAADQGEHDRYDGGQARVIAAVIVG